MGINSIEKSISKLDNSFSRDDFYSSKEQLNKYLKQFALSHQKKNLGTTYVLHFKDSTKIIGYYTICTSNVKRDDFPLEFEKKLPHYPIPVILIAKLCVDDNYKLNGFGSELLKDALIRSKNISEGIGCFAIIVDAIDEEAKSFYKKYGFLNFNNEQFKLFLAIKSIP